MKIKEKMFKTYFGLYSTIAPNAAAKTSFNLFQTVRKKDIRPREEELFNLANHFQIMTPVGQIDCYHLGDKNHSPILLVHGWDSNAGSMSKLAFEMVEKGHSVYLFNLPGHAFYDSNKTNLLECSVAMTAIMQELDLGEELSIISHSFGSAVTAMTLANSGLKVNRVIFLTNPNRVEDIFTEFKSMIGLKTKAYQKLISNTEAILGKSLENISVAKSLEQSNFNSLYLIHDKFDKVLPYNNALSIKSNMPNTHLETFERIGHYKMLWNEDVLLKCNCF